MQNKEKTYLTLVAEVANSGGRDVLKQLSKEDQQVLEDYLEKINLIAEHECRHLYVQGAKDCVELLKKLGVL